VQRCEYTWPATPEHVRDARSRVTELAQRAGAPSDTLDSVRLAVSEAVGNAILHGYRNGLRGQVTVVAEADEQRLKVVVRDEGCGMRPRPDSPGAGLGLPLIAEVAQSVSVSPGTEGRGTELCMTFGLERSPQPA
jgi:serine/threonine-protein kinase RsbW/stage II sporulation protein AB (anti-sigma F factor)